GPRSRSRVRRGGRRVHHRDGRLLPRASRRRRAANRRARARRARRRDPGRGRRGNGHPDAAPRFTPGEARARWHDEALWFVREKRDRAARALPEWEALRDCAAAIKAHTLDHLAWYLAQFEAAATARGAHVHWARDAAEHNQIVHALLAERFVTRTV